MPSPNRAQTSWVIRRDEQRRERDRRADVWRAAGEPSAERIQAEYERLKDVLDERLRPWARPIAAWTLTDGEPRVASSHMGGRPAMYPDEAWPGGDSDPMRFWAQVNLADLAPYAQAFDVAMPSAGLLQLFAADEGGELARYIPATDLERLQLRERIPIGHLWADVEDAKQMHRRSLLIGLYPKRSCPGKRSATSCPTTSRPLRCPTRRPMICPGTASAGGRSRRGRSRTACTTGRRPVRSRGRKTGCSSRSATATRTWG
jgi:hypothetical protein